MVRGTTIRFLLMVDKNMKSSELNDVAALERL